MDRRFVRKSDVNADVETAFDYHERPGALERLTPPWEKVEVLKRTGGIADRGQVLERVMPFVTLLAQHEEYERPVHFHDFQVRGPFAKWDHWHRFEPIDATHARVIDDITYRVPLGALGHLVAGAQVAKKLDRIFTYRHTCTRIDLERIMWANPFGKKRIAITGATGFIGSALSRFLSLGGHTVVPMVRGKQWDPAKGTISPDALDGVDAVVHLAGEPVADRRWTPAFKERVLKSREDSTRLLSAAIAKMAKPPVFISTSAVGYYGDRQDTWVTEDTPSGDYFLSEVCRRWEAASVTPNTRVVNPRIGLVLSLAGGPLPEIVRPFNLGAGGAFASGTQYMPWIGIDDMVGVLHRMIFDDSFSGPVNCAAPNPVTNREFGEVLGRVMSRPSIAPIPAFALRMVLGKQKAQEMLLGGQRIAATKLKDFRFLHTELEPALRHLLGKELGHVNP